MPAKPLPTLPTPGANAGQWGEMLNATFTHGHSEHGQHAQHINVREYGAIGDGVANDGPAIQAAIDLAISQRSVLFFPAGDYRITAPLVFQAPTAGAPCRVDVQGARQATLIYKGGSGFAVEMNGWRDSRWSGLTIDFANGNGGMRLRCENNSIIGNIIEGVYFKGGHSVTERELPGRIALQFVGSEPSDPNRVTYFNTVRGCHFNICETHIHMKVGGGTPVTNDTRQPNAQRILDCLFERYVTAIDCTTSQEHIINDCWFHQSPQTSGGAETFCFVTDGLFTYLGGTMEPGPGSRPYLLGPNANHNQLMIRSNIAVAGIDQSQGKNLIVDRTQFVGVTHINNAASDVDNANDVSFFGNGAVSKQGSGTNAVRIFSRNGAARHLALTFNGPDAVIKAVSGQRLILEAGDDAPVQIGNGKWNKQYLKLGAYSLWVDSSGQLRIKNGAPSADGDGTVVGQQ